MTNSIDRIVQEAEERLNRFYKAYGEDKPKEKSQKTKSPPSKGKIINRPYRPEILTSTDSTVIQNLLIDTKISSQPEPTIELGSQNEVSFENLKSKQIIDLVKDLTGITINICVKSKKNVIRHAVNILKEKNIPVKSIN